jgi:hypothetical protein
VCAGAGLEFADDLRKVFFSEEKNQKTFVPPLVPISRPWPGCCRSDRNKSLLLLFFRKEESFFSAEA